MNPELAKRLKAAAVGGAMVLAAVLASYSEGTKYVPYQDTGGVWTVCTGHTGPDVIPGKKFSDADCSVLLQSDLKVADAAVRRNVLVPMPDMMRAALIDFVFNLGESQFKRSALLRKLNARDYVGACAELKKWVLGNGRRLNGLVTRREAERQLCTGEFGGEKAWQ